MRRREEEEWDIQAIVRDIASRHPTKIERRAFLGTKTDILVSKGVKKIAIELKHTPVTLLDIRRLLHTRYNYKIIAVPPDALLNTSDSVLAYAEHSGIIICALDNLPDLIDRL